MLPTLLAAVGVPDVKERLTKGYKAGNTTYKVHLDGYNLMPWLKGEVAESPRKEFLYWSDDGKLVGLRYTDWKVVFSEQREHGFKVWAEPFVDLRVPKLFNLSSDPFERADHEAMDYPHWQIDRVSSSCRRRHSWPTGCRASRNSPRARSQPTSASTK
jgi:arylsulfatase A-like enzyme